MKILTYILVINTLIERSHTGYKKFIINIFNGVVYTGIIITLAGKDLISTGEILTIKPPFSGDAVLYLKRKD